MTVNVKCKCMKDFYYNLETMQTYEVTVYRLGNTAWIIGDEGSYSRRNYPKEHNSKFLYREKLPGRFVSMTVGDLAEEE